MTGTVSISRGLVIMVIIVPLAALIGVLLARPDELQSVAILGLLLGVLSLPILIQWHHPILVFSWNAALIIPFLPGQPNLWMFVALISLFWTVLNKTLHREYPINHLPWLTWSLVGLGLVVVATAELTGGMGIRSLGGQVYGGKKYFYILFAIVAYFAISAPRIAPAKTYRYATIFFLSGLTAGVANFLYYFPNLWFLYSIFPVEFALGLATEEFDMTSVKFSRLGGLTVMAQAVFSVLLLRYGIRGVLDLSRPWRVLLLAGTISVSMFGGFRSNLILLVLLGAIQFFLEGLHRTRWFLVLVATGVMGFALLIPLANRLPLSVQRTLTIVPLLQLNPAARADAQNSTEWRLRMWEVLVPEIPQHLLIGKGYTTSATDYYLGLESFKRGFSADYEASLIAGDYHNGPLSIIIPFGLWGVLAFLIFCGASIHTLYRNWRFSPPGLKTINTFLFAAFLTRFIFFLFIFGAIHVDILHFVGLMGLSVSLNAGVCKGEITPLTPLKSPSG